MKGLAEGACDIRRSA